MSRDPYPGLDGRDPDEVDLLVLRVVVIAAVALFIAASVVVVVLAGITVWTVLS